MTPKQKRLQKVKRYETVKSFLYYVLGAFITAIILAIIGVNL